MFTFDLQTKMAQAWLDTAMTGLAVAASAGAAMARAMEAWSPAARYAPPAPSLNGWASFPSTLSGWPWSGFGAMSGACNGAGAWPFTGAALGADWMRALGFSSASVQWPLATVMPMTALHPAWNLFTAFAPRPSFTSPFWPTTPTRIEFSWPAAVVASYRTASGHAATPLFNGFDVTPARLAFAWPELAANLLKH